MRRSSSNGHSNDNRSNRTHILSDFQQGIAGVNNPNIPILDDNTGTNSVSMPKNKHDSRTKVIWTRSGWVSHGFQRLGIIEEQKQPNTHLAVGMHVVSIQDPKY